MGWLAMMLSFAGGCIPAETLLASRPAAQPTARSASVRPRVLEAVDGDYGRLEVIECRGARLLTCDGVVQTAWPTDALTMSCQRLVQGRDYVGLLPWVRPQTRRALVLGLGGGLHAAALNAHGITVDAVDIDPQIVRLARKYFRVECDRVVIDDARTFLERDDHRYDAIVLDTFAAGSIPEHLYTREALALMKDTLTPGGVLVIHLIAAPHHPVVKAVAATARTQWSFMIAARSGVGDESQHVYLFASGSPLRLDSDTRAQLEACSFTGEELYEPAVEGASVLVDENPILKDLTHDLRRPLETVTSCPSE